jgi:2-amino-4-hydroxy-6-hydroxymethyldihydropteridine diphosphokinase
MSAHRPCMANHTRTAYIALGANLPSPAGPPASTLASASEAIARLGVVIAASSLYQTEPVGLAGQPGFLNGVLALRSALEPEALLSELLAIERQHGRDRHHSLSQAPRTLDLDLLLVDDLVLSTPTLVLPHPSLHLRRFVLAPLEEIAPTLVHPLLRRSVEDLLQSLVPEGPNRPDAVLRVAPPPVVSNASPRAPLPESQ